MIFQIFFFLVCNHDKLFTFPPPLPQIFFWKVPFNRRLKKKLIGANGEDEGSTDKLENQIGISISQIRCFSISSPSLPTFLSSSFLRPNRDLGEFSRARVVFGTRRKQNILRRRKDEGKGKGRRKERGGEGGGEQRTRARVKTQFAKWIFPKIPEILGNSVICIATKAFSYP